MTDPSVRATTRTVHARVNDHDYNSLLSALNNAVDILYRNRRPDPAFVAAYDTLKQSRAMIEKALATESTAAMPVTELAA